ncbi:MAG: ATP-binding protein [Spirochaetia bacterium]|nr:ATP-binding protein [Spirochaetia bacterium]
METKYANIIHEDFSPEIRNFWLDLKSKKEKNINVKKIKKYSLLKQVILLTMISIIVLTFSFYYNDFNIPIKTAPLVQSGVLDLRQWNLEKNGSISLNGQWDFFHYENKAQNIDDIKVNYDNKKYINVPSLSNLNNKLSQAPEKSGIYRLKIITSGLEKNYGIHLNSILGNYTVFINGIIYENSINNNKNLSEIFFVSEKPEIEIIINVSNHFFSYTGIDKPILFGTENMIKNRIQKDMLFTIFVMGAIFFMALHYLFYYGLDLKEKYLLFFSMVCLMVFTRTFILNHGLLSFFNITDIVWQLKIKNLTLFLGVPFFSLFFLNLLPDIYKKLPAYAALSIGIIFSIGSVIHPIFLSNLLFVKIFHFITLILGFYTLYVLILSIKMEKKGTVLLLAGFIFSFGCAINDILYNNQIINTGNLTGFGFFIFIIFQSFYINQYHVNAFNLIKNQRKELQRETIEKTILIAASRDAEVKYRNIFDNASEGIIQFSRRGRILLQNLSFAQLLGYESVNQVHKAVKNIKNHLFLDVNKFNILLKLLDKKKKTKFVFNAIKKDKSKISICMRARSVFNENNELIYYEAILQDITAIKTAQKMKIAKETAEATAQAKSKFLANMSHEIRTPLNAIIGLTEIMIREKSDKNEFHDHVETIYDSGRHLLSIINDILDVSKIEAGKIKLEEIQFDLRKNINSIIKLLKHSANKKNLFLKSEISKDLPAYIIGDPVRLRQVIINLIGNAIKFTHKGGITLKIHNNDQIKNIEENQISLLFSVADTGIGVSPKNYKRIFDDFDQADSSTSRKYGGTGLGLFLVKKLTEAFKGEVWIESKLNEGSTFYFTAVFQKANLNSKEIEIIQHHTNIQIKIEKGLDILLIEDNPINAKLCIMQLENLGHKVKHASGGKEALSLLHKKSFDFIFTDIEMPNMNGFETAKRIRKLLKIKKYNSPIPIIAMTAHATEDIKKQCLQSGIDNMISKPALLSDIEKTIRSHYDY